MKASPCAWSGPKNTVDFITHCEEQAGWCEALGSPFTAALCRVFAEDAGAGGVVARLVETIEPPHRKRATSLRLAGALHYAVLTRAAPQLAKQYPPERSDWDMDTLWPLARDYLERDFDAVAAFIQSDPQTNETRRSIALLPGFLEIARRFGPQMHLLELGASAGLNQCFDQFSYSGQTWQRLLRPAGAVHVSTRWEGASPALGQVLGVDSRTACDLNPIDLRDPDQRLRLTSYTWADQAERLARLEAAMALALENDVKVEKADAADWLEAKLADRPQTGTTVVFHSVFLHYPPSGVRARITQLIEVAGRRAAPDRPLAWLCMEPDSVFEGDNPKLGLFKVRLQTWPQGEVVDLAETDGHVTYVKALS